jgi:predicted PhzF superfamily epimerase YddE/YHI9
MVRREDGRLILNFPARPPHEIAADPALVSALGGKPTEMLAARDYLVCYASPDEVRALSPDMEALKKLDRFACIVTAPGRDCDFVSRFFAPAKGIPEDPVTGSAHCTLIPYWAARLGKTELFAKQISARGGELLCKLAGERVEIAGHSVLFLRGTISI